jgi:hypothetical protein
MLLFHQASDMFDEVTSAQLLRVFRPTRAQDPAAIREKMGNYATVLRP